MALVPLITDKMHRMSEYQDSIQRLKGMKSVAAESVIAQILATISAEMKEEAQPVTDLSTRELLNAILQRAEDNPGYIGTNLVLKNKINDILRFLPPDVLNCRG